MIREILARSRSRQIRVTGSLFPSLELYARIDTEPLWLNGRKASWKTVRQNKEKRHGSNIQKEINAGPDETGRLRYTLIKQVGILEVVWT